MSDLIPEYTSVEGKKYLLTAPDPGRDRLCGGCAFDLSDPGSDCDRQEDLISSCNSPDHSDGYGIWVLAPEPLSG